MTIAANAITRVVTHGAGARFGITAFRAKAQAQTGGGRGVRFPRTRNPRRYGPRR